MQRISKLKVVDGIYIVYIVYKEIIKVRIYLPKYYKVTDHAIRNVTKQWQQTGFNFSSRKQYP